MGNCMDPSEGYSDELPLHTVYVSAFYMDKYEVTKALWDTVYQWAIAHGYSFDYAGSGKAANHPVQSIDWYDCGEVVQCAEREGGEDAGLLHGCGLECAVSEWAGERRLCKWSSGYRLPTEAEWEKAARGGASGQRFPWGNTITWSQANYYSLPIRATAYDINPTRGFIRASTTGVFPTPVRWVILRRTGMGCTTWRGTCGSGAGIGMDRYSTARRPTLVVLLQACSRVLRGGCWGDDAFDCRAAYPLRQLPDVRRRQQRVPVRPAPRSVS